MKMSSYPKIRVLFSSVVFIALSLYFRAFYAIFIFYILALIHELFHVTAGLIFKLKVKCITFHPLGFNAELENIDYLAFYKQIIIYLAGPISYFFSELVLLILLHLNYLSIYGYVQAHENNLSLLIFNLLPFYPLDGGRIMEVFLLKIFPSLKAKKIRVFISSIISVFLLYKCIELQQWLLFIFIGFNTTTSIIFFKKEYLSYLRNRLGKTNSFPSKIVTENKLYHFNYNIVLCGSLPLQEDKYIIKNEINSLKKRKKALNFS